jgi:hypothetical protein
MTNVKRLLLLWAHIRAYIFRYEFFCVGLFFICFLAIGCFSFRDYGVPYDEGTLSQLGMESYAYVFEGKPYPQDLHFRFHGTAVELPLYALTKLISHDDSASAAYVRRFCVFVFLFLSVWTFYFIARRLTQDWRLACVGCLFFVLSPRVFAHGFYNSRDIPAMALFTAAMLTLLRLLEKRTFIRSLTHGVMCGLALGIRMPMLILIPITISVCVWDTITKRNTRAFVQKELMLLAIFLLTVCIVTIAVWPLLWEAPLKHLLDAYLFMRRTSNEVIFLGNTYYSVPWFYIPAWIGMTTPLFYSFFFLIGCLSTMHRFARERFKFLWNEKPEQLIPLVWFFLPIIAIVVTKAAIYQEWRHVLFIYPGFLLIALLGVQALIKNITRTAHWRFLPFAIIVFVIIFPLSTTGVWMLRHHPFENVYYAVPRQWISSSLDIDYWGLSTRQAVQYIADNDSRPLLSYYSPQNLALLNGIVFFKVHGTLRIVPVTDIKVADYVVVLEQPGIEPSLPALQELYSINVDGMTLVHVYEGTAEGRAFMDSLRTEKSEKRLQKLKEASTP